MALLEPVQAFIKTGGLHQGDATHLVYLEKELTYRMIKGR
jgi:hypothetical protein